jgi:peptide/nickel transport system permease protein
MAINIESAWEETTVDVLARRRTTARETWRRFARNRLAVVGLIVVVAYVVLGLLGPLIAPYNYAQQNLIDALLPPGSGGHILGTDEFGRDVFSRVLVGIRISLLVGFGITFFSVIVGGFFGLVAGYYRGKIDALVSVVVDVTWGFPMILVAVLLVGSIGPGLLSVLIAVAVINWAGFARIVRGEVLSIREREFIDSARALGVGDRRIIMRHIVPHVAPTVTVMSSYYVAVAIIFEAAFSFIGMGVQPPTPSLGEMIGDGRNYMFQDTWLTTVPGLAIMIIVIALNLLGDGLRDAFDPRMGTR